MGFFYVYLYSGPYFLLLADSGIMAAAVVGNGIFVGWARRAAKANTSFSLEEFTKKEMICGGIANVLAPIVSRALVDSGSPYSYSAFQIALFLCNSSMSIAACVIVRRGF